MSDPDAKRAEDGKLATESAAAVLSSGGTGRGHDPLGQPHTQPAPCAVGQGQLAARHRQYGLESQSSLSVFHKCRTNFTSSRWSERAGVIRTLLPAGVGPIAEVALSVSTWSATSEPRVRECRRRRAAASPTPSPRRWPGHRERKRKLRCDALVHSVRLGLGGYRATAGAPR
jgi:hypothetical protein